MKVFVCLFLFISIIVNFYQSRKVAEYKADIGYALQMGYDDGYGDALAKGSAYQRDRQFHKPIDVITFGFCYRAGCPGMGMGD